MNRQQTAIAKRAQIIALHDEGLSSRVIAQRLAVSRTTVQKWIHRHEEIGNLLDAERRPRPRLTSRAQDEAIQQAVRDDPFTNAVSIRKRLRLNVNAQTVRRRLREAGLRHRIPARKERLSEEHRAARLAYARHTNHGIVHKWRPYNTRYDRRNIFEEARSGHVTVKVWGWIFIHGMGDIVRIEGRFTAAKYLEILENFFIPSLQQRNHPFPPGPIIYVQDRCPIHTAHTVQEWFRGREDVELLDWPSKGADLNPIENVWANMEPEMERRPEALMAHTQAQWEMFRNKPNKFDALWPLYPIDCVPS
ncbi:hypothetical protein Pcinc_014439 [Petrolisthes cinctipes]|uniref:Transposase n=1 Tax=Petrolisthes cinctipes TaxID=88211 RepID=A0AAE1FXT0_PETCI|nr:hypothetical protein Pcinc_014439 [Petrolisthes cinctipes]